MAKKLTKGKRSHLIGIVADAMVRQHARDDHLRRTQRLLERMHFTWQYQ